MKRNLRSTIFLSIGHLDELKMTGENVAMYRLISKPYEIMYMSWSLSDSEGQ